ncbi:hypothetical protein MAM1_0029d02323 [Mucor ambiguus]|uniref:Uncharacterized protein n=1 Tax=Mucor ambiguus TaxID=91626 RepID=A0A0C9M7E4_9FUNG|nr:hypothetical protein MAM1_0029d02323 [Mucor ambiguus]
MPLNIDTSVFFKDKHEGDAADSKDDGNGNGIANKVETGVSINGDAEQEATDDAALPPTAKHIEMWVHLRPGL